MTVIERINAGLNHDTPSRVEWRSLLETALFEIERLTAAQSGSGVERAQIEHAIDHFEPPFIAKLANERETWIADNMRHEILMMVRRLPGSGVKSREDVARAEQALLVLHTYVLHNYSHAVMRSRHLGFEKGLETFVRKVRAALALPHTGQPVEGWQEIEALRAEVASKSEQIGKLYKVCNDLTVARNALRSAHAFIGVMFGQGPEAVIPETVPTPLGVPVKIGQITRDINAALSPAPALPQPRGTDK